jgi:hypothetical protein
VASKIKIEHHKRLALVFTGHWPLATSSGCFTLLDVLFPGFDFNLLAFDVETKAVVDAHVLICNPYQGEEREQISTPVFIEQLVARDYQKQDCHVVAETIFTGKKIEKFPLEEVAAVVALPLAVLARLSKDFFVSDGPGNRCNWYG